jgi:hypothetical protein
MWHLRRCPLQLAFQVKNYKLPLRVRFLTIGLYQAIHGGAKVI